MYSIEIELSKHEVGKLIKQIHGSFIYLGINSIGLNRICFLVYMNRIRLLVICWETAFLPFLLSSLETE